MIEFYLILSLVCVVIISLFTMISNKLQVATPILLVIIGVLATFVPNFPLIEVSPDLIFYIFLPPLLYEASFQVSWKELWKWRRMITSFAFIVVFFNGRRSSIFCK